MRQHGKDTLVWVTKYDIMIVRNQKDQTSPAQNRYHDFLVVRRTGVASKKGDTLWLKTPYVAWKLQNESVWDEKQNRMVSPCSARVTIDRLWSVQPSELGQGPVFHEWRTYLFSRHKQQCTHQL